MGRHVKYRSTGDVFVTCGFDTDPAADQEKQAMELYRALDGIIPPEEVGLHGLRHSGWTNGGYPKAVWMNGVETTAKGGGVLLRVEHNPDVIDQVFVKTRASVLGDFEC
jgi:hypothetical protein